MKKLDPLLVAALRRAATSIAREGVRAGETGHFLHAGRFAEEAAKLYMIAWQALEGKGDADAVKKWIEAAAMKRNANGHAEAFQAWQEIRQIAKHLS